MESFKLTEENNSTKKNISPENNNTLKRISKESIKEAIPSPKEYLEELKIKNKKIYEELKNKVGDKNELEEYIEKNLKPLYLSYKQENNNNKIYEDGKVIEVDYETGFNYALTDEGKLVHYSEMGENVSNYDDMRFVGYGIFWHKKKDIWPNVK